MIHSTVQYSLRFLSGTFRRTNFRGFSKYCVGIRSIIFVDIQNKTRWMDGWAASETTDSERDPVGLHGPHDVI
jgi:hypothetical protein